LQAFTNSSGHGPMMGRLCAGHGHSLPGIGGGRRRPADSTAGADPVGPTVACSSTITPMTSSRWHPGHGWDRTTRWRRHSTSSTPAGRRRPRIATTTWASCRWRPRRTTRSTCTGCPRRSPCSAPSRTVTCRWKPGRRCTYRTRRSMSPDTWRRACRNRRVFRQELRAIAAGQGRRGVLQPRLVPWRRHQPDSRRQADGPSAAGVLGVRASAGERRPDQGHHCPVSNPVGPQ
jgi:hypothetical protein